MLHASLNFVGSMDALRGISNIGACHCDTDCTHRAFNAVSKVALLVRLVYSPRLVWLCFPAHPALQYKAEYEAKHKAEAEAQTYAEAEAKAKAAAEAEAKAKAFAEAEVSLGL